MKRTKVDRISVSAVRSFLTCQRQYELSNIHRIERKVRGVHFAFGTALHSTAEAIWKNGNVDFVKHWTKFKDDKIDYYEKGNWFSFCELGKKMIDVLHTAFRDKVESARAYTEFSDPIVLDGSSVTLSRRLDLVAPVAKIAAIIDGKPKSISGPAIFDLKSSARKYDVLEALWSSQLMGYMPAVQSVKLGFKPKYAAFIVVTKTKNPEVQVIGTTITTDKAKRFVQIASTVSNEANHLLDAKLRFPMNSGSHCKYCDFFALCYEQPGWKSKYQHRKGLDGSYETVEDADSK